MQIEKYESEIQSLVEAVQQEQPHDIRRIVISSEAMDAIHKSNAFKETVSKYYGDSSTMIMDKISSDAHGRIMSFYLNGVLVVRKIENEIPTMPAVGTRTTTVGKAVGVVDSPFSGGFALLADNIHNGSEFHIAKDARLEIGISVVEGEHAYLDGETITLPMIDDDLTILVSVANIIEGSTLLPTDIAKLSIEVVAQETGEVYNANFRFSQRTGKIVVSGETGSIHTFDVIGGENFFHVVMPVHHPLFRATFKESLDLEGQLIGMFQVKVVAEYVDGAPSLSRDFVFDLT